jgi:hypothetical protein
LQKNKIQQGSDEIAERNKLHNESVMSDWERKNFWCLFVLGLLCGVYSTYNFLIKSPNIEKELKQIKSDILKNKGKIRELHNLVLTQKNQDSLNITNSELDKKRE